MEDDPDFQHEQARWLGTPLTEMRNAQQGTNLGGKRRKKSFDLIHLISIFDFYLNRVAACAVKAQ